LLDSYVRLADEMNLSEITELAARVSSVALRQASLGCLRRWQADADVGNGAMATVMAAEWVQNLAVLEGDLEGPVNTAVEAAGKPWWR
jgi:hypothetical protein